MPAGEYYWRAMSIRNGTANPWTETGPSDANKYVEIYIVQHQPMTLV